jgi:hypothetical protein
MTSGSYAGQQGPGYFLTRIRPNSVRHQKNHPAVLVGFRPALVCRPLFALRL